MNEWMNVYLWINTHWHTRRHPHGLVMALWHDFRLSLVMGPVLTPVVFNVQFNFTFKDSKERETHWTCERFSRRKSKTPQVWEHVLWGLITAVLLNFPYAMISVPLGWGLKKHAVRSSGWRTSSLAVPTWPSKDLAHRDAPNTCPTEEWLGWVKTKGHTAPKRRE